MDEKSAQNPPPPTCSIQGESSESVANDPPISAEMPKEIDPDTVREPKRRRKNCPSALDNFDPPNSSQNSSSFTFDTKFTTTPESTPKFGSFNLALSPSPPIDWCGEIPASDEKSGGEEEGGSSEEEIGEERSEVVGVLSSINGVGSA